MASETVLIRPMRMGVFLEVVLRPRTLDVQMDNVFYLPGLAMDKMIVVIIQTKDMKYVLKSQAAGNSHVIMANVCLHLGFVINLMIVEIILMNLVVVMQQQLLLLPLPLQGRTIQLP